LEGVTELGGIKKLGEKDMKIEIGMREKIQKQKSGVQALKGKGRQLFKIMFEGGQI